MTNPIRMFLSIIDLNRLNNSEQPGRFFIDTNMRFTNIK
ncbi:hypothetical protein CLOL250_02588 [Clostridium sp. L2-50]|nr:hypothetical protein CLOL250_02588 [Clostridium sp. L2-50]